MSLAGPVTAASGTTSAPDIYYLVFDRYGSADSIERRFGITDNDLYDWLADRGFQVPADSRGSYRATDFSLAAVMNMQYLDNLTEEIGRNSDDRTPAAARGRLRTRYGGQAAAQAPRHTLRPR